MNWAPLLEDVLHEEIPLTQAMQLRVEEASPEKVRLWPPLPPNDNHKGTAFGGSLYSLAVLSGWSLCWVRLKALKLKAHIVIRSSSEDFLKPATNDIESHCQATQVDFEAAIRQLGQGRMAKVPLSSRVFSNGIECMKFKGIYVLLKS